jgi:cytochrome c oxidase subunit 4
MSAHIASKSLYFAIFVALALLTALTVGVTYVDLGPFNLVVAMAIAVVKAALVVLFFMHLYWSERLTHVVAVSGIVFLFILFAFTLSDYFSRGLLGVAGR